MGKAENEAETFETMKKTPDNANGFKQRLAKAGLSGSAIEAAWPEWWSDAADASPSALADAKFSVARKLGLDPRSLLGDSPPRFVWKNAAKYKNFSGTPAEQGAITSFGMAVSRQLLNATPQIELGVTATSTPHDLRKAMLSGAAPFVTLRHLLALCWGIGIPVIHLRVYPLPAKRMCAMAVRVGDRYAILLARDSEYPAPTAFHLAHELGHIMLSHLQGDSAIIDMADPGDAQDADEEEQSADQFALALLTGQAKPDLQIAGNGRNPLELAQQALALSQAHRIEPGTLALCYGYATKNWGVAVKALSMIYSTKMPVWSEVNRTALKQLALADISEDSASYVRAVLGGLT